MSINDPASILDALTRHEADTFRRRDADALNLLVSKLAGLVVGIELLHRDNFSGDILPAPARQKMFQLGERLIALAAPAGTRGMEKRKEDA